MNWATVSHFLTIAGSPIFAGKRRFREFLFNFALEEEPHYKVAAKDLENLGFQISEEPPDVKLRCISIQSLRQDHL